MNIFENAPEFITKDNRRLRSEYVTTFQSIAHRLEAQLPISHIQGKTILDLGSCLGAAGYYSLMNGATHYTGIELQKFYANTSKELLCKYCDKEKFKIVKEDLLDFLDSCINKNIKFDVTLAAGILYEFMDPIAFLQKVCKVTNETIIIDTKWIPPGSNGIGIIAMRPNEAMVRGVSSDEHSIIRGIGSMMCVNAVDMVMSTESYYRNNIILPRNITDTEDPYNTEFTHLNGHVGPKKIILRYKKDKHYVKTLNDVLIEEENNDYF
jgi:16S rRNA G966 N2-methylase RsmD